MIISNALKTFTLSLPFAVAVIFGDDPGRLEGRFFPVAKNYQIVYSKADDKGIFIDMVFSKQRDCKFKSLEFYILNNSNSWVDVSLITSSPASKPYSRPVGVYEVSWLLDASKTMVNNPMKITTHHKCWGILPWDVETVSNISSASQK